MKVMISEFTMARIDKTFREEVQKYPRLYESNDGRVTVEIADWIMENIMMNFGPDPDIGINETLNHNERVRNGPRARTEEE